MINNNTSTDIVNGDLQKNIPMIISMVDIIMISHKLIQVLILVLVVIMMILTVMMMMG